MVLLVGACQTNPETFWAITAKTGDGVSSVYASVGLDSAGHLPASATFTFTPGECPAEAEQIQHAGDDGERGQYWFLPGCTPRDPVSPHLSDRVSTFDVEIWAEVVEEYELVVGERTCEVAEDRRGYGTHNCESQPNGTWVRVEGIALVASDTFTRAQGESAQLSATHEFDVDPAYVDWRTTNPGPFPAWSVSYRLHAYVRNCTLDTGAACGDTSAVAGFSLAVGGTAAQGLSPSPSEGPIDVSGTWYLTIDVTEPTEPCSDEDPFSTAATITQNGDALVVDVFGEQWEGTIAENAVTFGGSKVDGDGTTDAVFDLVYARDGETETLTGSETWTYVEPGWGTCEDSVSVVTATR